MLSGFAFAVLIAGVATTPAAADQSIQLEFLVQQTSASGPQGAEGADAGQSDSTARKAKRRVRSSDLVIVKVVDVSTPK
jgi:hypothetical protein